MPETSESVEVAPASSRPSVEDLPSRRLPLPASLLGRTSSEHPTLERLSRARAWRVVDGQSDVRGWDVRTPDGKAVGTVVDLIVDLDARCVRYLEVAPPATPAGRVRGAAAATRAAARTLLPIGNVRLYPITAQVLVEGVTLRRIGDLAARDRPALPVARARARRRRPTRTVTALVAGAAVLAGLGVANTARRARAGVTARAADGRHVGARPGEPRLVPTVAPVAVGVAHHSDGDGAPRTPAPTPAPTPAHMAPRVSPSATLRVTSRVASRPMSRAETATHRPMSGKRLAPPATSRPSAMAAADRLTIDRRTADRATADPLTGAPLTGAPPAGAPPTVARPTVPTEEQERQGRRRSRPVAQND